MADDLYLGLLNPELLSMADQVNRAARAREAAVAAVLEKRAVQPPTPDPMAMGGMPPGGDPSMMGGAPPGAMPPGAPPGGDPAAAGMAPMTDPALAAAGGGAGDMASQVAQQVVAQMGGAGGKPGAGGKAGKPDVAVELAEVKDVVYKIGMMVMGIYQHLELPITPAMMIGQAPATSDPALSAASQDPSLAPQPGATDGAAAAAGAQGGAPAAGAPKQASYPGEVEPPSLEELEKTAEQLRFLLSGDADSGEGDDAAGDPGDWDWAAEAMKAAAERYGPAQVGMPHAAEYRDALTTMGPNPTLMARALQRRMR